MGHQGWVGINGGSRAGDPLPQEPGAGAVAGTAFMSVGCGCACVNDAPVIGPRCPGTSHAGLSDLYPAPSLQDTGRAPREAQAFPGRPSKLVLLGGPPPQQGTPGHSDSRIPPSHPCDPVLFVTNTAPLRRTSCFCAIITHLARAAPSWSRHPLPPSFPWPIPGSPKTVNICSPCSAGLPLLNANKQAHQHPGTSPHPSYLWDPDAN